MRRDSLTNVIPFPRATAVKPRSAEPPPPSPIDVFAEWFRSVPAEADLALAAAQAIAQIDRRASSHPDVVLLRAMLASFAGTRATYKPVSSR